jgi:predicted ATPase/class 3 adenylate cyclase
MVAICSNCGAENPGRARFCLECGAAFRAREAAPRETRKTVTVVFSDLTDSTSLGERLDPESLNRIMARWFHAMRTVLERHGGTVQKFIGDAVMAVFGVPVVHEDDAVRAVRAAADLRDGLAALNKELMRDWGVTLEVRTGVNTGEVMAGNPGVGDALVVGDAVNVAARLEQAAAPGQVLLGPATYALVRDAVRVASLPPVALKGKRIPVAAVRLVEVLPGAPGRARRADAPLVGRVEERRLLDWAYERVVGKGRCHLVTVLGVAGVGKSRLVAEALTGRADEATILAGRCLPYGEGITFWPIAEAMRQAAGITETDTPTAARAKLVALVEDEPDAERVAAGVAGLIGLAEAAAAADEAAWSVRRLLETVAARRPLVVVLDDLHWAEPTLLELVESVADWSRTAPILLLVIARPELLEQRPTWGGGKANTTSILLEPLDTGESAELLAYLAGPTRLAGTVRDEVTRIAGGNPLFLQEIFALLLERGELRQHQGRWVLVRQPGASTMPPNIQALLAARLDHLDGQERAVLERGAVAGEIFEEAAVVELSPWEARPAVANHLLSLIRKELLRSARSRLSGGEAFQFRHLLIRDAAYDAMPKQARADLHQRFAAWLEQTVGQRVGEYEEIIGHHLEQAYRYWSELGPTDAGALRLAGQAAERLAAAGNRASARADIPAAANLLARAAALLPDTDGRRLGLLPNLGRVLIDSGRLAEAAAILAEATERARAVGDRRIEAHAQLGRFWLDYHLGRSGWLEETLQGAEQLISVFNRLGDDAGLAKTWRLLSEVQLLRLRIAASQAAAERAVEHARRAGDRQEEASGLAHLAVSAAWGRTPVPDAIRRTAAFLAQVEGRRNLEAAALKGLAGLRAMTGDFEAARELMARHRAIVQEIGRTLILGGSAQMAAYVEMLAGNPRSAERELRRGYEILDSASDRAYLPAVTAMLAQALQAQGRHQEAERHVELASKIVSDDDIDTQFRLRVTQARLLAARGQLGEAERLARAAIELMADTDELELQADGLVALAEALAAAGRPGQAAAALDEALGLYREKGNLVSAERVHATLAALQRRIEASPQT